MRNEMTQVISIPDSGIKHRRSGQLGVGERTLALFTTQK